MFTKNKINPIIPSHLIDESTRIFVNPTGRFVIGGPKGDSGLTGRKIIVDTYGGYAPHGGGAFSGKDPTKVDRSACYMARYVAKNMVAAGFADKMEIQLSYAIGVAEPTSICVETFGTSKYKEVELVIAKEKIILFHMLILSSTRCDKESDIRKYLRFIISVVSASSVSAPSTSSILTPANCPALVRLVIEMSTADHIGSPESATVRPNAIETEKYPSAIGTPSLTPCKNSCFFI